MVVGYHFLGNRKPPYMSMSQMYASNFAQQGSSQGVSYFNFHSVNVKQYTLQSCQISKKKDEFMV